MMTGRPSQLADLFFMGKPYDGWEVFNRSSNRFFVVNLTYVISALSLNHTSSGDYFRKALLEIGENTEWPAQANVEFQTSHTQVYPTERSKAKTLGRAACIIVAMEMAAKDKAPGLDVYDHLRIIPAWSFIDDFDMAALHDIEQRYKVDSKAPQGLSFREHVLRESGQFEPRLLEQMATGYCVTEYVAERIREAILPWEPYGGRLGPVRSAGEARTSDILGSRNAAAALRVVQRAAEPLPAMPSAKAPIGGRAQAR